MRAKVDEAHTLDIERPGKSREAAAHDIPSLSRLDARAILRLQASAGNAAVSRLLAKPNGHRLARKEDDEEPLEEGLLKEVESEKPEGPPKELAELERPAPAGAAGPAAVLGVTGPAAPQLPGADPHQISEEGGAGAAGAGIAPGVEGLEQGSAPTVEPIPGAGIPGTPPGGPTPPGAAGPEGAKPEAGKEVPPAELAGPEPEKGGPAPGETPEAPRREGKEPQPEREQDEEDEEESEIGEAEVEVVARTAHGATRAATNRSSRARGRRVLRRLASRRRAASRRLLRSAALEPEGEKKCECGGAPGACKCGGHAAPPEAAGAPLEAEILRSADLEAPTKECECGGGEGHCSCGGHDKGEHVEGSSGPSWDGEFPGVASLSRSTLARSSVAPTRTSTSSNGNGRIQRLGLGDIVGAALPSWVTDAVNLVRSGTTDAAGEGQSKEAEGTSALNKAVDPLKSGLQSAERTQKQQAETEKDAAQQEGDKARNQTKELSEKGTQAAGKVQTTGPAFAPMLNPGIIMAQPERVLEGMRKASDTAKDLFQGCTAPPVAEEQKAKAEQQIGPGAKGAWSCDEAEVIALASGVARDSINRSLAAVERSTGMRPGRLREGVSKLAGGVRNVASSIGSGLKRLGSAASNCFKKLRDLIMAPLNRALEKLRAKFESIKTTLKNAYESVKETFLGVWTTIKDSVSKGVTEKIENLRNRIGGIVARVQSFANSTAGKAILKVVGAAAAPLLGLAAAVGLAIKGLQMVVARLVQIAETVKNKALELGKSVMDKALQGFTAIWQKAKALIKSAKEKLKSEGKGLFQRIKEAIPEPVKEAAGIARDEVRKLLKAGGAVVDKVTGQACASFKDAGEACAEQYLPDMGEGGTRKLTLSASADVTVPLDEIGVPANLKVGKGAVVEISREGGKKADDFQVKISGEGVIALSKEKKGEAKPVEVDVSLPGGNKAKAAEVWRGLSAGKGQGGQAKAPDPKGGGGGADGGLGAKGELEIKGRVDTVYKFSKGKDTCEGLGGMVALLGLHGLSNSLPAPFDALGGAITQHAFRSNIVSQLFTASEVLRGTFSLEKENIGKLEAAIAYGAEVTVGKGEGGAPVHTLKLFGSFTGTAALEVSTPVLGGFGGSLSGGLVLALTLDYVPDLGTIMPVAASAELTASASMNNFDPSMFASIPGAKEALSNALARHKSGFKGPSVATIEAKVGYKVEKLEALARRLNRYFDITPASSVTTDNVLKEVKLAWDEMIKTFSVVVTLKESQSAGVSIKAAQDIGGGAVVGAGASVTAEQSAERVIFSYESKSGGAVTPGALGAVHTPAAVGAGAR